jgi:CPA2 family monovalent cation:H+ antiporter-2
MAAAPADTTLIKDALVVLGAAAIVVPVFHSLRVSPVLGYILIGMIVGPSGLGTLSDTVPWLTYFTISERENIEPLAEFGVVLLLFTIGLELTFDRLTAMRRLVFGLGPLQLVLSAAAIGAGAYLVIGEAMPSAVLGFALAMSSTAIVLQVLTAQKQMRHPAGRVSFGVLLFQDLAVVPILFTITVLAQTTGGSIWGNLSISLLQAAAAIGLIFVAGRLALRPLFHRVAATKSPELFMAACLLVILATGLTAAAAGLSMAMGALIAGIVLAETEFSRQIEVMIEPFKGLLVGLFLISIGMSVDLARIADSPAAVAVAATSMVAIKALIVALLARLFISDWGAGVQSGLILGGGSEFSFVIIALSQSVGILSPDIAAFALIIVALTMAAIPLLDSLGRMLAAEVAKRAPPHPATQIPVPQDATPRIIVAGFGRVGRIVAALLDAHNLPYIAVDSNADAVAEGRAEGKSVFYGDIRNVEFLRRSGIAQATALVITMDSPRAASEVVPLARSEREDLKIIVRARDANHAAELYKLGATDAVPETVEASLQLGEAVLVDVGVAMGHAIASIHEKRAEIRAGIQAAAPNSRVRTPPRKRLRDSKPVG